MYKPFPLLKNNIRNQFFKMLFTLILIFIGMVIIFFLYVKSSNERLTNEREEVSAKAQIVSDLAESYNGIFFRARGYYAFQDEQELDLLYENLEKFELLLDEFAQFPLTKEEKVIYAELMEFHQEYKEVILPKAISYVEVSDYKSLRELSSGGTNDLVNKFVAYTKEYNKQTENDLKQLFSKILEQAQQITLLSLLLGGLVLLFVGMIMRRVLLNLIQPIEQLTVATNAIASGRFIDLGNLVQKEDELGILANSFYKMTLSIQEKEEVLTTQNEELMAQQDELQGNQDQLQHSLDQLQKFNQLNHVLTFTLDKQKLLADLHKYLNDIYAFDTSILYLVEGQLYVSKGLTKQSADLLVENFNEDKQVRLEQEKSFVITREVTLTSQDIAQQSYFSYDLYSSVLNSEGRLVAVMMATREGHKYSTQEIEEINGLMNRVSIAFERILMYEEVERSRQLNQNIIDTVNEGIQFVSPTGDVVLINEALSRIIRYHHKMDNQHVAQWKWLKHFEAITDQPEELTFFFKNAVVEDFEDTRTIRYSILENTPVFVEVYATSVYEGQEKIGTMFVHRDITREYEVDQMKSELVSTVSHELRTPLSSVLGFTELLLTKELKPERQKKYIETIHKEAIRLTNLINDFLDLQRMESGRQQYKMEQLCIDELAIDIVNRFRHEEHHRVHLVDKAKTVNIMGDQERLVQLLINLIGNAIKFSPNGGDVVITLENVPNRVQISVKDQGIGIPQNEISKLFQKFKRIDNSARRKIGGTGLGLAICKEIVTQHGGDIWIESEEGQGTTVYFTLPVHHASQTLEEMNVAIDEAGLNVMIVEDDLSLALLLSEELKSNGFTVIYHDNPKRAFEEALHTPLVGIVIDLMLGDDIKGWDLVQLLKETAQTSTIPIIISSALDESKEYVEKFKVEKYFTKPYHPEELSKILIASVSARLSNENIVINHHPSNV
ncbi:ATP-binding protein [Lysinibacillus sp. KU-BSD001]|uniref:ATP-binding protein n=1 Tax=Lysinibacillus sp. KU-BSD001 TaxID=3141328 RepID=UPI0036EB5DEB